MTKMGIFTNLFKSSPEKQATGPCKENGECLKNLQLILDGEATAAEEKHFADHIEECMPCFKRYEIDMTIKTVMKTKCNNKEVPQELVDAIKLKIRESV